MATTKLRLRPDRNGRSQELSIYVQVCIEGKVKLYSTGVKADPQLWDSKNQKIRKKQRDKSHISNNIILDKRHQEIKDIIFARVIENKGITFDFISQQLNPKESASTYFQYWFGRFKDDQSREVKGSTLKHYAVVYNQIMEFSDEKDFELETINFDFYSRFRNWLIDFKGQRNSTVNKRLKILKTFLRYCSNHSLYDNSQLHKFKMLEENASTKVALTEKELSLIVEYDFSETKRLEKARDVFVFSCLTGLRESDVQNLKKSNIKDGFIYSNIIKTSQNAGIPISSRAENILTKYNFRLPKIAQQNLNKYIKEIGEIVGINEEQQVVSFQAGKRFEEYIPKYNLLSSHVGRRTFITLSILKGIPTPIIQSITGHKDLKSFQKYIQLNNNDKKEAMKLWDIS